MDVELLILRMMQTDSKVDLSLRSEWFKRLSRRKNWHYATPKPRLNEECGSPTLETRPKLVRFARAVLIPPSHPLPDTFCAGVSLPI